MFKWTQSNPGFPPVQLDDAAAPVRFYCTSYFFIMFNFNSISPVEL